MFSAVIIGAVLVTKKAVAICLMAPARWVDNAEKVDIPTAESSPGVLPLFWRSWAGLRTTCKRAKDKNFHPV